MPTYYLNTRVRRTWRERLLSWPWRPWQATKIVTETITGPYPWARDPIPADDFINLAQQRTRPFPKPQVIRATTPRAVDDPQPAVRNFYDLDPAPTFRWAPDAPYRLDDDRSTFDSDTPLARPFTPGGGGDFGGGGATSTWSEASSCSTDTSSSDSGSSNSGSSCGGD